MAEAEQPTQNTEPANAVDGQAPAAAPTVAQAIQEALAASAAAIVRARLERAGRVGRGRGMGSVGGEGLGFAGADAIGATQHESAAGGGSGGASDGARESDTAGGAVAAATASVQQGTSGPTSAKQARLRALAGADWAQLEREFAEVTAQYKIKSDASIEEAGRARPDLPGSLTILDPRATNEQEKAQRRETNGERLLRLAFIENACAFEEVFNDLLSIFSVAYSPNTPFSQCSPLVFRINQLLTQVLPLSPDAVDNSLDKMIQSLVDCYSRVPQLCLEWRIKESSDCTICVKYMPRDTRAFTTLLEVVFALRCAWVHGHPNRRRVSLQKREATIPQDLSGFNVQVSYFN